jgi:tetratricopeptide (TPR) repeat protein
MGILGRFRKNRKLGDREEQIPRMRAKESQNSSELSQTLDMLKVYECPGCGEKNIQIYLGKSNQPPLCPKCGRLTVLPSSDVRRIVDDFKAARESDAKANQLCDQGKYKEAIEWYDRAIAADASDPEIWYNKSIALLKLGRAHQALACCEKATHLNPHNVDYWLNQGASLNLLNKPEEALRCFDSGLEVESMYTKLIASRFGTLVSLNRKAEAKKYIEEMFERGGDQLTREVMELIEQNRVRR